MDSVTVLIMPVRPDAVFPEYKSPGAAGVDLYACIDSEIKIEPMQRAVIPTGVAVCIPEGYEGQVRPRSGMAANDGVTVLNSPGTIDCDYRGELLVILINHAPGTYRVRPGARIAQLVVAPIPRIEFTPVQIWPATDRGAGGLGSTGD